MVHCSFVIWSPVEIDLPRQFVLIDPGRNVFTAMVEDLDAFLAGLLSYGVKVLQVNRLDEHEALPAEAVALEIRQDMLLNTGERTDAPS